MDTTANELTSSRIAEVLSLLNDSFPLAAAFLRYGLEWNGVARNFGTNDFPARVLWQSRWFADRKSEVMQAMKISWGEPYSKIGSTSFYDDVADLRYSIGNADYEIQATRVGGAITMQTHLRDTYDFHASGIALSKTGLANAIGLAGQMATLIRPYAWTIDMIDDLRFVPTSEAAPTAPAVRTPWTGTIR